MNRTELVERVAEATGEARSRAAEFVDATFVTLQNALVQGERVTLPGFGTFSARPRKARTGRNPQTGAAVKIPATTIPVFKAGSTLKDLVSGRAKLTVKKTAGGRGGAKSSAKSGAKKTAAAKKSTAKKSTAKAAKSSAKKSTAKKSSAKKSTAKKR